MDDPATTSGLGPGSDEPIDPETVADDRFIHGLLGFVHGDSEASQRDRVDVAMQRIRAESDHAATPVTGVRARVSAPRRLRRWSSTLRVTAGAAGVLAAALIAVFVLPVGRSADASAGELVALAVDAARTQPRSYVIRVQLPHQPALPVEPLGRLDVDGDRVVIRMATREGHDLVVGRDATGPWAIRRDGGVERYAPERAWPRWLDLGEGSVLLESIDALVDDLRTAHALERRDDDAETGSRRVVARPIGSRLGPDTPDRTELWLDPVTGVAERLELHWSERGRWPGPPAPGAPPPGERRPEGPGPRNGPPRGGFDGPGNGDGPRGPGGPGGPGRPGGPGGPGMDRDEDRPARRPGPPGAHRRRPTPPPSLVVFELETRGAFPADWFTPATHAHAAR